MVFKMHALRRIALISCAALLVACDRPEPPAPTETEPEVRLLSETRLLPVGHWRVVESGPEGAFWLAFYDEHRQLWLRDPAGAERRLDLKEEGQAPSGLAAAPHGSAARIAWRDKIPEKGLYVLDTADDRVQEVSAKTEALARFGLYPATAGTHLLWYGERRHEPTGARYNLHYAYLDDAGALHGPEWLMPGIYPVGLADGDAFAAFSWVTEGTERPHIAMRRRAADDTQFSEPVVLDSGLESLSPIFLAASSGDHWIVLWVTMERDGVPGLSIDGVRSVDRGQTWERFTVDGLRGFDPANLSVAMDGAQVVLTASGRWPADPASAAGASSERQYHVFAVRSADGGLTWDEPMDLRGVGETISRAQNAHAVRGATPGELWLVWEDWREVRPRAYGAYSRDFGRSFTWQDLPISPAAEQRIGVARSGPIGLRHGAALDLIVNRYTSNNYEAVQLVAFSPDAEAIARGEARPARLTDEAYLRARATEYWQAMADRDYERSYALLDPFTRDAWLPRDYQSRQGRIAYHSFEILSVSFNGHLADVRTKIVASVPRFEVRGTVFEVPEREAEFSERWIFVDGDWYREYHEEGSGLRFTKYR